MLHLENRLFVLYQIVLLGEKYLLYSSKIRVTDVCVCVCVCAIATNRMRYKVMF